MPPRRVRVPEVRASSASDIDQGTLLNLFQVIASGDQQKTLQVLAKSPELVRTAGTAGATRYNASAYFLKEIGHYVYPGDTALHIASAAYDLEIARELLSRGAGVRARNRRGAESLHYAADGAPGKRFWPKRQSAIIGFLIRAGADPNSEDKSGVMPLHRAVRTRCAAAVLALIENGADPLRRNGSGSTPLHLAVQNTGRGGSGSAIAREEQAKIIRILLDHGAKLTDADHAGKSVKECIRSDWIRTTIAEF